VRPKDLPGADAANDGPVLTGFAEWLEAEMRSALEAGELACDCGALLVLEAQPDGRKLILCSAACGLFTRG
jgi:hypothetical protein